MVTIIELMLIWVIPFLANGKLTGSDIASCITIDLIVAFPLYFTNKLIKTCLQAWGIISFPQYEEPKQEPQGTLTLRGYEEEIELADKHLKEIEEWRAKNK